MEIKASSNDPISGIHNYCDRWCEKCSFIKRCSVGLIEIEFNKETSRMNPIDKAQLAIDKTKENLEDAVEMLNQHAKDNNIDLFREDYNKVKILSADNLAIIHLAESYLKGVLLIFAKMKNLFEEDIHKQLHYFEMSVKDKAQIENEFQKKKIALETIQQYMLLIPSKLRIAIRGKLNDTNFEKSDFQKDWNGTAKLVKITTSRSIRSWEIILSHFFSLEEEILQLLSKLEKIRNYLEKEFPKADKFIRPGFDTSG
jgi:hypothetical protein